MTIEQSHGGAGTQARAVIDGLEGRRADAGDRLRHGSNRRDHQVCIPKNWQQRLPHNSCPYTSTIVFLVRKGNPKGIKDWDDLVKPGVEVITPNPKTSGGARYNYLAAWGYALKHNDNDRPRRRNSSRRLFKNVPVLDSGARGSTTTFVQREIGDVLLAWENEALLALKELGDDKFELVVPSVSILAEPPVTVVDKNAAAHDADGRRHGRYLEFLYTPVGQTDRRPRTTTGRASRNWSIQTCSPRFLRLSCSRIDDVFGSWSAAQQEHFADGGVFDQIQEAIHN